MKLRIRGIPSRLGLTANREAEDLFNQVGLNPGNLAFTYATALMLGFPESKDWISQPEECELSVYPLANQLGEHFNSEQIYHAIKSFHETSKVVAIGLGGQNKIYKEFDTIPKIGEKDWRWIDEIVRRSPNPKIPNISVRGEFTRKIFEQHGRGENIIVTGCPSSMLSPHQNLGVNIYNKFLSLPQKPWLHSTLGCPWEISMRQFEQRLIALTEYHKGYSHVQMDIREVKIARGEKTSEKGIKESQEHIAPHISLSDYPNWARRIFRVWWDVPAWMEALSCADFVFGSRIHGVNLAIQAGTPAICATWDSRTYELCRQMEIPHINLWEEPWNSGRFSWDNLKYEFAKQFDPEAFDKNRKETAIKFKELLTNQGISISQHLIKLST